MKAPDRTSVRYTVEWPGAASTAPAVVTPDWTGGNVVKATCSVDDCDNGAEARGWCRKHYKRWQRNGNPTKVVRVPKGKYTTCTMHGCDRAHASKGLCRTHLGRLRHHGDPGADVRPRINGTTAERVAFYSETQDNGCVHWTGHVGSNGYGQMGRKSAHVVAYELHHGPVPNGLVVDHVCHNRDATCSGVDACLHRRCVNPAHLEAVTQAENMRRAFARHAMYGPDEPGVGQ